MIAVERFHRENNSNRCLSVADSMGRVAYPHLEEGAAFDPFARWLVTVCILCYVSTKLNVYSNKGFNDIMSFVWDHYKRRWFHVLIPNSFAKIVNSMCFTRPKVKKRTWLIVVLPMDRKALSRNAVEPSKSSSFRSLICDRSMITWNSDPTK